MRTGSRSSAERKLGFSHINPHTSAVKTITIRIKPGIARKPTRRSSLSSRGIATHGKGAEFARKVDRVVLNAMATNAALPPDICAFGGSSAIDPSRTGISGEADPPLHAIAAPLTLARERNCAKENTAL